MAKRHLTDLRCKETVYITPQKILDPTRTYCGGPIPLDPATEPNNPTGALTYCIDPAKAPSALEQLARVGEESQCLIDGLAVQWSNYAVTFVNPPYGKGLRRWCKKIYQESILGATILALLPAGPRFSTRYFQEYILSTGLSAILFVRGRVQFQRPDGTGTQGQNPYDSMIMGYGVDVDRFVECYRDLGKILVTEVRC